VTSAGYVNRYLWNALFLASEGNFYEPTIVSQNYGGQRGGQRGGQPAAAAVLPSASAASHRNLRKAIMYSTIECRARCTKSSESWKKTDSKAWNRWWYESG